MSGWDPKYDSIWFNDDDLDDIMDIYEPPTGEMPWHPTAPIPRYYGMVFYWFDRSDFDVRLPLGVTNHELREKDATLSTTSYIRWGGMFHRGCFCIVVQDPRAISSQLPNPDDPSTWVYRVPGTRDLKPFPDRTKMRWGYVNISQMQIFLHWWYTCKGSRDIWLFRERFLEGIYRIKEWPAKDPLYPLYQRVVRALVMKDWRPRGSYFDLRKM